MATSNREIWERELKASQEALKAHQEGIEIHKVVCKAFEEELEKYPKKKKENPIVK